MSSRTPDHLKNKLESIEQSLNDRTDQRTHNYGPTVTRHASCLKVELDNDYDQRDLEKLVAAYQETFPEFYNEEPVSSIDEYLDRFDSIENAIQPLDTPEKEEEK